jgi:biopolymer transport protein ExbB/TolQ
MESPENKTQSFKYVLRILSNNFVKSLLFTPSMPLKVIFEDGTVKEVTSGSSFSMESFVESFQTVIPETDFSAYSNSQPFNSSFDYESLGIVHVSGYIKNGIFCLKLNKQSEVAEEEVSLPTMAEEPESAESDNINTSDYELPTDSEKDESTDVEASEEESGDSEKTDEEGGAEEIIPQKKYFKDSLLFPLSIPKVLAKTSSKMRLESAVIGMASGVVIIPAVYFISGSDSTLGAILDPTNFTTFIPYCIIAMFFWGLALTWFLSNRIKGLEMLSQKSLLLEATKSLSFIGVSDLLKDANEEIVEKSPLLRRLKVTINQWMTKPGLHNVSLVLEQNAAFEEEDSHSNYTLLRTFIWALPVLGLTGTVLGIFFAVGGFSKFLGGNIDDVNIIKEKLVGVTGGLSYAFLITLMGLLPSLILMLITSALQMREGRLYNNLHHDISNIFLPELQIVEPEEEKKKTAEISTKFEEFYGELFNKQQETLTNLSNSIAQFEIFYDKLFQSQEKIITNLTGSFEKIEEKFSVSVRIMNETLTVTTKEMSDKFAQLVNSFAEKNDSFLNNLNDIVNTEPAGLKYVLDGFNASLSAITAKIITESQNIILTFEQEVKSEIPALISKLHETQEPFINSLNVLSNSLKTSDTILEEVNSEMRLTLEKLPLYNISDALQAIIESNGLSKEAIDALNRHSSLIEEISRSQEYVGKLLKNLSKPLEFRIFPSGE